MILRRQSLAVLAALLDRLMMRCLLGVFLAYEDAGAFCPLASCRERALLNTTYYFLMRQRRRPTAQCRLLRAPCSTPCITTAVAKGGSLHGYGACHHAQPHRAVDLALPNLLECDRDLELGRGSCRQDQPCKCQALIRRQGLWHAGFFSPGENLTLTASNVPSGAMGLLELAPGGAQFNMRGATCEKLRLQVDLRRADRTPKIQIQAPSDSKSLLKVRMAYARGLGNVYLTGWCTLTPAVLGQMPASAQRATAPSPPSPPPPPPRFGTAPLVEAHRAGAPLVSPTVLRTRSVTADALGGDRCPRNVHCTLVVNLVGDGSDGARAGVPSLQIAHLSPLSHGPTRGRPPRLSAVGRGWARAGSASICAEVAPAWACATRGRRF